MIKLPREIKTPTASLNGISVRGSGMVIPNDRANRDTRRVSQSGPFDGGRVNGNQRIAIHWIGKIPENDSQRSAKLPAVVLSDN